MRTEKLIQLKDELREHMDSVVKKTRQLTVELTPSIMNGSDLNWAINGLCVNLEKKTGIVIKTNKRAEELDLGEKRSITVFKIFQEVFANIVKHSEADIVEVSVVKEKASFIFLISDNGVGFDYTNLSTESSLGLINMKEWAILCEGSLTIESAEGEGTAISLTVPYKGKK